MPRTNNRAWDSPPSNAKQEPTIPTQGLVSGERSRSWKALFQEFISYPGADEWRPDLSASSRTPRWGWLRGRALTWKQNREGSPEPLLRAAVKSFGTTALHLQLFQAISFRKTLINKAHYSFRITVQLVLNLPVTKEILHLRKHHSINLTTEQTIPSGCLPVDLWFTATFLSGCFFFFLKLRCLYPEG